MAMQFSFFEELLRLFFSFCNNNSILFVSAFDQSGFLISYNYSYEENRFTHVSNSFSKILGYDQNNILHNGNFATKIIHPDDKNLLKEYLNGTNGSFEDLNCFTNTCVIKRTKFRARHVRGYWKFFVIFSMDYQNSHTKKIENIGLIADEYLEPNLEVVSKNRDSIPIKTFISNRYSNSLRVNDEKVMISLRESEILEFISKGLIAKEIATILNISLSTVISHRKNLIFKFNVTNTAELISKASKLMLI